MIKKNKRKITREERREVEKKATVPMILLLSGTLMMMNLEKSDFRGAAYLFLFILGVITTVIGTSKFAYVIYKFNKRFYNNEELIEKSSDEESRNINVVFIIKTVVYSLLTYVLTSILYIPYIFVVLFICAAYALWIFEDKISKKLL